MVLMQQARSDPRREAMSLGVCVLCFVASSLWLVVLLACTWVVRNILVGIAGLAGVAVNANARACWQTVSSIANQSYTDGHRRVLVRSTKILCTMRVVTESE